MKEPVNYYDIEAFVANPIVYDMRARNQLPVCDEPTSCTFYDALHTYVLQGEEEYKRRFCVDGRGCKGTSANYISREHHLRVLSAAYMIFAHDYARDLLNEPGVAFVEVTADCAGVRCQASIDYLNSKIVELEISPNPTMFGDIIRYKHIERFAFSQIALAAATGKVLPVYVIAVTLDAPYEVAVFKLDERSMNRARDKVLGYIDKYADYLKNGVKSTCIQELRIV